MFIIQAPSAYRLGHLCLLGSGTTEQSAWEDAYGPEYKSSSVRKTIRKSGAFCNKVSQEEFEEIAYSSY